MPKNAPGQLPQRRSLDSRSDGEGMSEERGEISSPRVVKRAVKLRFGGARPPVAPALSAVPELESPSSDRPRGPLEAADSSFEDDPAPPHLEIELGSRSPPRPARPLRSAGEHRPRTMPRSLAPAPIGERLRLGIAFLVASIALGVVAQVFDVSLGPVRLAWVAGVLMMAGIASLFYRLLPRDR
jgi:hypothetical protein